MTTLRAEHLTKQFRGSSKPSVDDVSFEVSEGTCLGIVGESGSGKSTLANIVSLLTPATKGKVYLDEKDITSITGKGRREVYRSVQVIFQDYADSFDPRRTLGASIMENGRLKGLSHEESRNKAADLLRRVGLSELYMQRYPRDVSGGEGQRASIARALMSDPRILICDEITSALDVSMQAAVVNVIQSIKEQMGVMFISHDLALVDVLCDQVMVMKDGKVVETGPTSQLVQHPKTDYSKLLISSVFPIDDEGWTLPCLDNDV